MQVQEAADVDAAQAEAQVQSADTGGVSYPGGNCDDHAVRGGLREAQGGFGSQGVVTDAPSSSSGPPSIGEVQWEASGTPRSGD
jgi:hypothetical protein